MVFGKVGCYEADAAVFVLIFFVGRGVDDYTEIIFLFGNGNYRVVCDKCVNCTVLQSYGQVVVAIDDKFHLHIICRNSDSCFGK